jgi:hypothetical protein
MLTYAVYWCEKYCQIISLLKSDSFENLNLVLVALHPNAELFLFKLLNTDMNNIFSCFNGRAEKSKINENIVIEVFGIETTDLKWKIN